MQTYIGTKLVRATPMDRQDYNDVRNWTLPGDENGDDEGYLVEYLDGGKPNHQGYEGYISWSPKAQFDAAYVPVGDVSGMPAHQQRVVAEKAELDSKLAKLTGFFSTAVFHSLPESEQSRLLRQGVAMRAYSSILGARVAAFSGSDEVGIGLTFGLATEAMLKGLKVARAGWNGKGMFVYYVPPASYPAQTGAAKSHFGEGSLVPYNAYFAIKNVGDTVSTWVPSVNDCLATDWAIV